MKNTQGVDEILQSFLFLFLFFFFLYLPGIHAGDNNNKCQFRLLRSFRRLFPYLMTYFRPCMCHKSFHPSFIVRQMKLKISPAQQEMLPSQGKLLLLLPINAAFCSLCYVLFAISASVINELVPSSAVRRASLLQLERAMQASIPVG